ncbi:MAG: phytanoyl-CoA dioxygenase family protein [Alphaproteobacteria bacterium]
MSAYEELGFHIERGLFEPTDCDALVKAGRALPNFQTGSSRPAMNPHRNDAIFLRTMANSQLVRIMRALCGGDVSGLQSEFFYGSPGTPGFAPHQDNFFVEAPGDAFASAWLALVDVEPSNGALYLYPGSHRKGLLPVEKLEGPANPNQDPNATSQAALLPPGLPTVDACLRRGDVLFIHCLAAHGSHTNVSSGWRYALLNTYIRRGAPFRPGRYAGRAEVDLDSVATA